MSSSPFASACHRGLLGASLLSVGIGMPAHAQDTITLDTVVVEGSGGTGGETAGSSGEGGLRTDGYVGTEARVGTKTDTDLRKVPQSVAVVSKKELEDRKAQTLVEAARYTAGVRAGAFGYDPGFDTLYIRGFNVADTGYYRDGLRSLGGVFSVYRNEPYGLEGVTILKGPSSVLYGSSAPGGLINLVSKRPTDAPFREIETQIGSHNRAQVAFDASGPLAGNDNVLYRITGLKRSADTELVGSRDDRDMIAPALTLRSDDRNTQITVLGEFVDVTTGGARGYVSLTDPLTGFAVPSGLQQGDPNLRPFDNQQGRIGYEARHRFNETVEMRQNLRYQRGQVDTSYVSTGGLSPDGRQVLRSTGQIVDEGDGFAVDNQVQVNLDTGPLAHTILGGLDYAQADTRLAFRFGTAPSLDAANVIYGSLPVPGPTGPFFSDTDSSLEQTGIYLQDQIEYQKFVLTLGGRYDWLDTDSRSNLSPFTVTEQSDENFSGRVGLSYLFDNGLTPYVSYSTSFAPTSGLSAAGLPFDPTEGEQTEVGLKYAPAGLPLTVDAALFRIRQSGLLGQDSNNINFQVQSGEVESEGFEVQATASIVDGLNLVASYTYLDLTFLEGDNEGNIVTGIPRHQFSLWGNYEAVSGPLDGLGLGLGARFLGVTEGNDANTQPENKSRILIDASASYDFGAADQRLEGVRAQVNVNNLFDKRDALCNNGCFYREQGRQVIGSLRYRF
ncbi:iron complex outermembrane recepter protein [Aureimonas phyllosphaerae]|nr:iron complex outermembrane recepter protein [Aureimonas phyllosphaerae]